MGTPVRKGMESTFDFEATRIPQFKTKQSIGFQNKPEQTYDRDFSLSVRDEAPRARRTADVTNDKQDVPKLA